MKIKIILIIFLAALISPCESNNEKENMTISLPEPDTTGSVSIEQCLAGRRSERSYKNKSLTMEEVSQVLWAAYGITDPQPDGPSFMRGGQRTSPSAGALYPLEIYLVASKVEGLQPGIYKYDSRNHKLEKQQEGNFNRQLSNASLHQSSIEQAAANLVYSAVFSRTTQKYGSRGEERYVYMEAGHSAENVCLQAYALKIGVCTVGAFNDSAVKKVIGMPDEEEPLYVLPMGKM